MAICIDFAGITVYVEEAEGGSSDTPLVIGQTNFSEKFSGLFHEAVPDQQLSLIHIYSNKRKGVCRE